MHAALEASDRFARVLGFGPLALTLASDDGGAFDWLVEVLAPWFAPTTAVPDWIVRLSSDERFLAELRRGRPNHAAPRACFAHDTQVVSLPSWTVASDCIALADDERACIVTVGRSRCTIVGDPGARRWRFTAMWALQEIAATRMRGTHLDVHAAAVEVDGRALLIAGPKGSGKTTLALHLLRSGRCRAIANDRSFVGAAGERFEVRGMPTAVKLRPPTVAGFPELVRGLPWVDRPYLYTIDELARARDDGRASAASDMEDIALSPPQLLRQIDARPLASAPLGGVVFPELRRDLDGWTVERLEHPDSAAALLANLYGSASRRREATIFEEVSGGVRAPSPDLANAIARSAPSLRLVLGPNAYAERDFAARLLDVISR